MSPASLTLIYISEENTEKISIWVGCTRVSERNLEYFKEVIERILKV